MVVDREEAEIGAGARAQLLVGDSGESALRVLHDDDGVDAEHVARERQAAQHVVGHPPACVADHVRLAELQTERREHVDAGVHARDHREVAGRARVGRSGALDRMGLVGGQEPCYLGHPG